jgi:polysaccharide biosynthesis protein PelA
MMLRNVRDALACVMMLTGCATPQKADQPAPKARERWAAYYDKQVPAEHFKGYGLVVFDRVYHPDFTILKGKTVVLAYVSAGEVPSDSDLAQQMRDEGLILKDNAHWQSHAVDLRAPVWQRAVIAQVQDAKDRGFDGVMLDTVDSPIHTIRPLERPDMQAAAINLIRSIRSQFPEMKIMLNRGFDILPQIAGEIDYALAESICAQTELAIGQSTLLPDSVYRKNVELLQQAKVKAPRLKLYTLDYWNMDDLKGVHSIYRQQREAGFVPYVSTPDLRKHTPEPILGTSKHTHALGGDHHA